MNHAPLTSLVSHFPGARWLQIEPRMTRKREERYVVQWEDQMGHGRLLFSQRQLGYFLTEQVAHAEQPIPPPAFFSPPVPSSIG